jgi:YYY domain-containing protein
MSSFFAWYLTVTLLGWLTFPLAFRLFPALADRGYSLSRALGLLVWGYLFWLLTSLGISQNDSGGILLALICLGGLSAWSVFSRHASPEHRGAQIAGWLKDHRGLVLNIEILFTLGFAFLAFVRASNPELTSAEKPMELMFINAILRSPAFPPRDAWLSGYAISYYYFGYVMTAMLAKLTSVPGTVAHNLMTALIFALGATGSYGIVYNLLSKQRNTESENPEPDDPHFQSAVSRSSFLAPLFLLLVSNLEGFFEVLHKRGLGSPEFWTWLDIKDLTTPAAATGWVPDRYLWWWRASRVIQDYDLSGSVKEVIDEFPFFSFLHADLHPHVLAIPFGLLAISIALNMFLGGSRGTVHLAGFNLHLDREAFFLAALTLGGLAFLNTWDILIAAALIIGAYGLLRVMQAGWSWVRLEDLLVFSIPLGLVSILLYLPFYLGFASQAGGILPNLVYATRGAHLWVMFAPLFVPLLAFLFYLISRRQPANWKVSAWIVPGLTLVLWVLSWLVAWMVSRAAPDLANVFLQAQGVGDLASLFTAATLKRLAHFGSLVTLLTLLLPAVGFLLASERWPQREDDDTQAPLQDPRSTVFALLLIALGALLVLIPEFIYLRDQFGWRINTVFKFYYQAWMLWSIAGAFGAAILLRNLRGGGGIAFRIAIVIVIFMALFYPVFGLLDRTENFQLGNPDPFWTLDYSEQIRRFNPDEVAGFEWLRGAPDGVVAEAIGGSYSGYGRVATYTGLPTVLGWPGHESQWRGGYEPQGTRQGDIEELYTSKSWELTQAILERYDIRYVYLGGLEYSSYAVSEEKFERFLKVVFRQGQITIYEVP